MAHQPSAGREVTPIALSQDRLLLIVALQSVTTDRYDWLTLDRGKCAKRANPLDLGIKIQVWFPWGITVYTEWKEGNLLFNDALKTFYLRLYGVRYMVKDHSDSERGNPLPHYMGYSFRLAARVLLYAPSRRQNNTYHGLCYTSRGALAGMNNSSNGPP